MLKQPAWAEIEAALTHLTPRLSALRRERGGERGRTVLRICAIHPEATEADMRENHPPPGRARSRGNSAACEGGHAAA